MTLRLRSWAKCQGSVLKKIVSQRESRVEKGQADKSLLEKPVSLTSIMLDTVLDGDFERFAGVVGGKVAETYLVRTLQYVASGHARTGCIPVSRDKFGTLVLSRQWDIVSKRVGERVYDALLESNIAVNGSSS